MFGSDTIPFGNGALQYLTGTLLFGSGALQYWAEIFLFLCGRAYCSREVARGKRGTGRVGGEGEGMGVAAAALNPAF